MKTKNTENIYDQIIFGDYKKIYYLFYLLYYYWLKIKDNLLNKYGETTIEELMKFDDGDIISNKSKRLFFLKSKINILLYRNGVKPGHIVDFYNKFPKQRNVGLLLEREIK